MSQNESANLPAPQEMQAEEAAAAKAPAGQLVQPGPPAKEKVPARQAVHVPSFTPDE